ncbi:hypothetical protein B0T16DRAFT_394696 [Cercophora newfieldiana]|uniref:Uncharacterized protein n=1 Tax=Cercophora newfieldiana TaxID=92897 RepID=A0AA39XSC6_9PEZI|nr:hypothetical protein B0T16DRAFT_394696 [Cercophora newfieldiana]
MESNKRKRPMPGEELKPREKTRRILDGLGPKNVPLKQNEPTVPEIPPPTSTKPSTTSEQKKKPTVIENPPPGFVIFSMTNGLDVKGIPKDNDIIVKTPEGMLAFWGDWTAFQSLVEKHNGVKSRGTWLFLPDQDEDGVEPCAEQEPACKPEGQQ